MKIIGFTVLTLILLTGCSRYPKGELVFVTNERDGTISVIDSATDKVIDTIMTGNRPRGIRMGSDGKFAYIAPEVAAA